MIYQDVIAKLTPASLKILPRVTDVTEFDNLSIINQSTNLSLNPTVGSPSYDSNNILTLPFIIFDYALEEGNFYELELTRNVTNEVIWRGVMFVSSQDKVDYTINKDEFKEKTSNNEYIILD